MKTSFENKMYTMLNNGKNFVEVDHMDSYTIISARLNDTEAYVAISDTLVELYYTTSKLLDFEEVLTTKLELADPVILSTRLLNILG